MNKAAFWVGLSLLPFLMMGMQQGGQPGEDPREQAEKILNDLSELYQSYDVIKADFQFILETREEEDPYREERKGEITMKGEKFKLDLEGQTITTDTETMWTYVKEANEVQVTNYDREEIEFHPKEIFRIYEEDYKYIYQGSDVSEGNVLDVVELTPKDKDDDIFKVRLYIDRSSGRIERSIVFEKDGMKYTYEILSMNTDAELTSEYFSFKEEDHPEVNIIDLR